MGSKGPKKIQNIYFFYLSHNLGIKAIPPLRWITFLSCAYTIEWHTDEIIIHRVPGVGYWVISGLQKSSIQSAFQSRIFCRFLDWINLWTHNVNRQTREKWYWQWIPCQRGIVRITVRVRQCCSRQFRSHRRCASDFFPQIQGQICIIVVPFRHQIVYSPLYTYTLYFQLSWYMIWAKFVR